VADVPALTSLAESVPLDGVRQDDSRCALGLHGATERGVNLHRIVPADAQMGELVVGEVLHHLPESRIRPPEVLADIAAAAYAIVLVLAVDHLAEPLHQESLSILIEEGIPVLAPQDLDHVPADAAEDRFQLLDDVAIAAYRSVEALQIAVHHEDQVVESLARGHRDGAQGLRLVRLAVPDEAPHSSVVLLPEPALLEVAHEPRAVERL